MLQKPFPPHIYLWHGPNDYEISQTVRLWRDKFAQKHKGSDIANIDVKDNSLNSDELSQKIKNILMTDSLFSSTKLVVIQNGLAAQSAKSGSGKEFKKKKKTASVAVNSWEKILSEILPRLSLSTFVIFWQKEAPAANKILYKTLVDLQKKNKSQIKEFLIPRGWELNKWIKTRVVSQGGKITDEAVKHLAVLVGDNLWQMSAEIDKLVAYANGEIITPAEAKLLVSAKFDDNIFNLMDAVSSQNRPQALSLLHQQIQSGANELYLLTMLVRQFNILLRLKDITENMPGLKEEEAAVRLNLHPYVVKKSLPCIRRFTLDKLKNLYQKLVQIDRQIKTGQAPAVLLFDLLMIES